MIDLHTHSTVSDGSEPPASIPERAAAAGCSAVALTDHDSLDGLAPAREAAARVGVTLVPGCEVSCRKPAAVPGRGAVRGSVHVLVYFVEPGDGPLQDQLVALRRDRAERNTRLRARLAELGAPVDYEAMVAEAGGEAGLGRPHFARALVRAGAAADIDDAFDRWLADGRPAYVPKARLSPADVARLATGSGGVAVLAHPLSLDLDPSALERLVRELAEAGLGGVEAIYGRYHPDQRRALRRMAHRLGLVATGGSDYHGTFKPDLEVGTGMGDLDVPDAALEELAGRRP
ncbi:MAG TPA: PHP domain-containing protein [Acidimicrobiales bacterium]|nr:PHP domain-containing protein [Acidimicrobiales bacterium]